jgi:sodium transport system permease protein
MRLSIIWTIFKKELTETLRDRRTLVMMIGLPVLVYPLVLIGFMKLQESESTKRDERPSTIAILGAIPPALGTRLSDLAAFSVHPWQNVPRETQQAFAAGRLSPNNQDALVATARHQIADRSLDAIIIAWPGLDQVLVRDEPGRLTVYYDSVSPNSFKAKDRLDKILDDFRTEVLTAREQRKGLLKGFSSGVELRSENIADNTRRGGQLLGMILPFMLVALSVLGALYPAIDLTAGEKERGTMQTLLCAPLWSTEIIVGKFLAVWVIALLASLANVVSLGATLMRTLPGNIAAPASAYALAFVMLIPVTVTVAAVFLAVAVFAKDFKDGQNFLTPLYMVMALPAAVTMLPGIELTPWTAFVPVVNIALLIKSLMLNQAPADLIFVTLLSSFAYAGLALLFAARVFEREQVLLGEGESIGSLLKFERKAGALPTPGLALVAFAALLVLTFYGSLLLEHRSIVLMLLTTEWGFFLLPTLALVIGFGFPVVETLRLRRPKVLAVLGSIVIGFSGWTVGAGLLVRLLPPPDSLVRGLERILLLDSHNAPLWAIWLVIGVSPAICEELFFRGFVLTGMRRLGMWPAIATSAFLFALAHSSIYRLLPTLFLGVLFGYVAWRSRSIACSMIAHALNNGLMATLACSPFLARAIGLNTAERFLSWNVISIGSVVLVVGLLLVHMGTKPIAASATPAETS